MRQVRADKMTYHHRAPGYFTATKLHKIRQNNSKSTQLNQHYHDKIAFDKKNTCFNWQYYPFNPIDTLTQINTSRQVWISLGSENIFKVKSMIYWINSLRPSDAYMRR